MGFHKILRNKNHIYLISIVLIISILSLGMIYAGSYSSGDFSFGEGDFGGEGGSGGNGTGGSGSGGPFPGEETEESMYSADSTSYLEMFLGIFVQNQVTEEVNFVFGDKGGWADGAGGSESIPHPFTFINEKKCKESCDPQQVAYCANNTNASKSAAVCKAYPSVCKSLPDTTTETPWCDEDSEPVLSFPIDMTDPKMLRFEGDMRAGGYVKHIMNPGKGDSSGTDSAKSSSSGNSSASDKRVEYGVGVDIKDPMKFQWIPEGVFGENIDWDANEEQCVNLGGVFGEEGCCGDDWMWVFNKPYKYDSGLDSSDAAELSKENELCIWSDTPTYGNYIATEDGYRCDPTGQSVYDPQLDEDDDNSTFGTRDADYFFAGSADLETDIGRWNNEFCMHYFDSDNGDSFEWADIDEAADANPVYCELFLGNNWTGSRCCTEGDTYSDVEEECDGINIGTEVINSGFGLEDPEFLNNFEERCADVKEYNRACLDGGILEDGDIGTKDSEDDMVNSGGKLYQCTNLASGSVEIPLINDSSVQNAGACQVVGFKVENSTTSNTSTNSSSLLDKVNNVTGISSSSKTKTKNSDLRVCTVTEGWEKVGDEFSKKIMNYDSNMNESDIKEKTHYSSVPSSATEEYYSECCFDNGCFDGETCVDEYSTYIINTEDGDFKPFDYSTSDITGDLKDSQAYRCVSGGWVGPINGDLNWYDDYRYKEFCTEETSCMCSSVPTPSYDFTCGEEFVTSGCTNTDNYFVNDHLCYNDEGSAAWTSRTKVLALKLYSYAKENNMKDYTIYCDSVENVVNNDDVIEYIGDDINNICILNASGKVYAGFTMNSDTKDMKANISKILFHESNGLIRIFMPTTYKTYNKSGTAGAVETFTALRDEMDDNDMFYFYSVLGGKALYNPNFEIVILVPEGSTSSTKTLIESSFSYSSYNMEIQNKKQRIMMIVNSKYDDFEDKGKESAIPIIESSRDFSRFYISEIDNKETFAYVETRYDPSVVALSSVVVGYYSDIDVDCDEIKQTYRDSLCVTKSDEALIVDKSQSSSFAYWQDLGSKFRLSVD